VISIEFDPPKTERCKCCGGVNTRLTRFVYNNGDAYAIYYALFSYSHPLEHVSLLVGIGEWGEGAPPAKRKAFYLRIRAGKENYEVEVR
jgi:hypothetical protein